MDALLNKILIYIACATSQTPFCVCVLIMTRKHLAAHNLLGRFAKLPGLALQIELAAPYTTSSLSFFLVCRAKRPRHANDRARPRFSRVAASPTNARARVHSPY